MSAIWQFSGETARAYDLAMMGQCGCPGQGYDEPGAHARACPRYAVLSTAQAAEAAAAALADAMLHPGRTIIDTTPVLPCGCRQGMCGGHCAHGGVHASPEDCARAGEIEVARAAEATVGFTGRCSCDALARTGTALNLDAHKPGCEARAVLVLNAAQSGSTNTDAERFRVAMEYWENRGVQAEMAAKPAATPVPASPATERVLAEREAQSSGRPENPGIPLWDEAAHAALAEMSAPMGLREDQLPAYDAVPPGCCSGCHLPVPDGAARCFYCSWLDQVYADRAKAVLADKPVREGDSHGKPAGNAVSPVAGELTERQKTCDHGGPRRRFVTGYPGVCTRCGEQTPAAVRHGLSQHLHQPGQRSCGFCSPVPARRHAGAPFFLLGLAVALLIAGIHLGPWLCLLAVPLAWTSVNRIRRRM